MKTSRTSIIILVVIIIIAVIFLILDQVHGPTNTSPTASTSIISTSSTTVSGNDQVNSTSTTSIDISSWKSYSNTQPPFSIKYPADLAFSTSTIPTVDGPYLLALQFPKDIYFSTVLKDEADAIVTASSTCPAVEQGPIDQGPQAIQINGITFTKNEVDDAAAGNRYLTITYDMIANGLCYRITFFNHGANGAGLYLSDTTAIQAADAAHDAELSKIEAIVTAMVGTFSTTASQ